jgi:hypothetical protein
LDEFRWRRPSGFDGALSVECATSASEIADIPESTARGKR